MLTIMFWLKLPGIAHNFFCNAWQPNKNEKCGLFFLKLLSYNTLCSCVLVQWSQGFSPEMTQIVALQVYFIQVFMVKQLVVVHV